MSSQALTALVTGGASGIGEATACKLASRGISVLVGDLDREGGEKIAAKLRSTYQVQSEFQYIDVTNETSVKELSRRPLNGQAGWILLPIVPVSAKASGGRRPVLQQRSLTGESQHTGTRFVLIPSIVSMTEHQAGLTQSTPRASGFVKSTRRLRWLNSLHATYHFHQPQNIPFPGKGAQLPTWPLCLVYMPTALPLTHRANMGWWQSPKMVPNSMAQAEFAVMPSVPDTC